MGSSALWAKWAVYLWLVLLGSALCYEFWCLLGHDNQTPPLTRVTIKYVPWYVTMPALGWLFYHFLVRYVDPNYVKQLRGK